MFRGVGVVGRSTSLTPFAFPAISVGAVRSPIWRFPWAQCLDRRGHRASRTIGQTRRAVGLARQSGISGRIGCQRLWHRGERMLDEVLVHGVGNGLFLPVARKRENRFSIHPPDRGLYPSFPLGLELRQGIGREPLVQISYRCSASRSVW